MIYDCFLFYNEFDLLRLRLSELADYVDEFILIETPWTFVGNPAPLLYKENPITGYNIRHVIIEELEHPGAKDRAVADAEQLAFHNEWGVKHEGAERGCEDADASDLIMCSDADEIVRPSMIREGQIPNSVMMQDWYLYWLNCRHHEQWPGTSRNLGTPLWDLKYVPGAARIPNAGWHFSAFGGAEAVRNKLLTGAHGPKTSQYADIDHVQKSILEGTDVLEGLLGNRPMKISQLEENLPSTILSNPSQWKHLMHPNHSTVDQKKELQLD